MPFTTELFDARDGAVLRLRIPGGRLAAADLAQIAALAESAHEAYVTSRGNLQLRGVADAPAGGPRFRHDVVASPLSEASHRLARRLAGALAGVDLPPRALLGVDSGAGDVASLRLALGLRLVDDGVCLIGDDEVTPVDEGVEKLVQRARAGQFLPGRVLPASSAPVGWFERADGLVDLGAAAPLGVLPGNALRLLAATERDVSFTPWQSVVIHGLVPADADVVVRVLAPVGLVFDSNSPWLRVSSCVGSRGCAHAVSDVRVDAAQLAGSGPGERVHFLGCARGCGRPHGPHTEYRAAGDGEYEVAQRGM